MNIELPDLISWLWATFVALAIYLALRYGFLSLRRFSPLLSREDILRSLRNSGRSPLSFVVEGYLVCWASDTRMASFSFVSQSQKGLEPLIVVYRRRRDILTDATNFIFRLGDQEHYTKVSERAFTDPNGWMFFVFDDVRVVSPLYPILSVILASYNGGSGGRKYVGLLDLPSLSYRDAGPMKVYSLARPEVDTVILAPTWDRVLDEPLDRYEFAVYSIEDAVFFWDIDDDGQEELITACMLWEDEECHWCPHTWLVSINDWTPSGFRLSPQYSKNGLAIVSAEKVSPAEVNGFIPGSVSPFGMVEPANLQRARRDVKLASSVIRRICGAPEADEYWAGYLEAKPSIRNFRTVAEKDFSSKTWGLESSPST